MCRRFLSLTDFHFTVIKNNYKTKVARAKNILRHLNATHINSCGKCYLGVSYVKTILNINRNSQC